MEGLEITEVTYSCLGERRRIDAQFYQKEQMSLQRRLSGARPLGALLELLTDGTHVTPQYQDAGVAFLSSGNISPFRINFDDVSYISPEEHQSLAHCHPRAGDVLVSKSGRIGHAAVVPPGTAQGSFSIYEGVALLRPASVDPYLLAAVINSPVGQQQIRRRCKGVAQPHLHLEDIGRLLIPELPPTFASRTRSAIMAALRLYGHAEIDEREALAHLQRVVGLAGWVAPEPLAYMHLATDVAAAGRLDAEFFHPRYRALLRRVSECAARSRRVGEFAVHCDRGQQPAYVAAGTLAVVNSRHILEAGIDYDNLERTDETNWYSAEFQSARVVAQDILTYTTGAKVGRTSVYLSDARALASNHVNILRITEENPIYVAMAMNSTVGRWQTRMLATGSAQVELYPTAVEEITIPFVDPNSQALIVDAVLRAHAARREASAILARVQRSVMAVVEESEAAALSRLEGRGE